jgi:hypothetical protein
LLTAGRYFSWIVLLGIPAICLGAVAAALFGSVDLNSMWIASALILHSYFCMGRIMFGGMKCLGTRGLKTTP